MAGYVRVEKMSRAMGSKVTITFDVRTKQGQLEVPITIEDQGSMSENERRALEELKALFDEAASTVQHQLG